MASSGELIRRLGDAINAGEVPDFVAPDYRFTNVNTAVTNKTYVGPDGLREWRHDFFEAFAEGAEVGVDEIVAEGDDYAVAHLSLVGRGATSGAPLEFRWFASFWFRNGQLVRSDSFASRREALAAIGPDA